MTFQFPGLLCRDVTAVAEMMAVGHYEDDHVWILDNSHSLHFIKEGVCTLYDPCQAPPLQRKEKAKGRYAAVKEEAAPPADVEGGGSKYTGAGAVKLATLTRGKFFGESCVPTPSPAPPLPPAVPPPRPAPSHVPPLRVCGPMVRMR